MLARRKALDNTFIRSAAMCDARTVFPRVAYQFLKYFVPRGALDRRRPLAAVVILGRGEVGDDAGGEIAHVDVFRVHQLPSKPRGKCS